MNKRNLSDNSQEHFDLLRSVHNNPNASQRDLAQNLNISLGKLNYLIKSFSNRGFIKINNFSKSSNKINYIYVLTPKGLKRKIEMTFKFMDAKLKEYDELKKEVDNVDSGKNKK